jgi:hypothetical protein
VNEYTAPGNGACPLSIIPSLHAGSGFVAVGIAFDAKPFGTAR